MQITERLSDRAIVLPLANFEHAAATGVGLGLAWFGLLVVGMGSP